MSNGIASILFLEAGIDNALKEQMRCIHARYVGNRKWYKQAQP